MVTMINVYAPPESTKCFFKTLFDTIAIETEGILICGGDYNVVMNHNLDATSPQHNSHTRRVRVSTHPVEFI